MERQSLERAYLLGLLQIQAFRTFRTSLDIVDSIRLELSNTAGSGHQALNILRSLTQQDRYPGRANMLTPPRPHLLLLPGKWMNTVPLKHSLRWLR